MSSAKHQLIKLAIDGNEANIKNRVGSNVYAFEITDKATKPAVEKAIASMYKVNPVKVRIVRNPVKQKIARGVRGEIAGVKKAYVFLRKGDKIEII